MAKKKEIQLNEFRAWLEGVEELQPKSWHPDATQWKLIRNKINCIVEPEPQIMEREVVRNVAGGNAMPPANPNLPPPTFAQPATPPPGESSLLPVAEVAMTDAAKAALNGALPVGGTSAPSLNVDGEGKIQTPNIDTADGSYDSSFA